MAEITDTAETITETGGLPPLPREKVPAHIAIIMDGNGRWAQRRGLPRLAGHRAGTENLREVLRACGEFGVKVLTIYAFSTENWGRPPAEVQGLLAILRDVIDKELYDLHKEGVQLRHIGELEKIDPDLQAKVRHAVELTRHNDRLILNVAFNYGGRAELVRAIREIISDGIAPEAVTEALVGQYLYTGSLPDPDLIIRTSGEFRLSNFLIWQSAYAEYYASDVCWPDFKREELHKALLHFANRDRRYGLVK